MAIAEEAVRGFLSDVSKAAEIISENVEEGASINVLSHLDADGLAAAGIIGKALWRLGSRFRLRVQQWMDEQIVSDITADKPDLTILADLGSGYLNVLHQVSDYQVVILDHHKPFGKASHNIFQVNPHIHGIDGARDLSGSGVAYFVVKKIADANRDLASIAIVGALGDLQDKYEKKTLGGLNEKIVSDAVDSEILKVEKDLMFFGRETRSIHQALAYTTSPFIPGISGEEDKSLSFLLNLGIKPKEGDRWRALRDLSDEEKRRLCSALSDHLISKGCSVDIFELIGSAYTLIREEPWTPLRDAREFSVLLNSTGRMEKQGLGVAICMGDRGAALKEANLVLEEYRHTISKYLSWLMETPDRIDELDSIYVIRGGDFVNEKMIGTLSSILSTSLPNPLKPVIAYAEVVKENVVKVSARTLTTLTSRGLDLGQIVRDAAERYEGDGGGHNIAAGAQVPIENVDAFISLVNDLVGEKVNQNQSGS